MYPIAFSALVGRIIGTPIAGASQGRHSPQGCPLSYSNSCFLILLRIGGNVFGQNISTRFDNQPKHLSHFRVMALYTKNDKFALSFL